MPSRLSSLIPATAALLLLYGCAKEQSVSYGSIEVTSVEQSEPGSKAVIDGTAFPTDKGYIGLSLFKKADASEPYTTSGATNIQYSYNSTKGKWTADPSIKVGSTPGYLYGYFPYKEANTDIKAIPVTSTLDGNDVMYASPQDAITDNNAATTTLKMNHALARVTIFIKKDNSYSGDAKLSKITFNSGQHAQSGTLNAVTGNITATKGNVDLTVPYEAQTISPGGTTYECLLVPSEQSDIANPVNIWMMIDGQEKRIELKGSDKSIKIKSGTKSTVNLILSNTGLAASTVSIDEWQTYEIKEYKVTITKPSGHDVLMDIYEENDNVMVKATSSAGDVLKMEKKSGNAFINKDFDPDKRVHTFTISNITTDIQAEITTAEAWNVSVNIQPFGAGSVSGAGKYEKNTPASLKVVPAPEQYYQFWHWLGKDGKIVGSAPEYTTQALKADSTYTAVFIPQFAVKSVFTVNSTGAKVHFAKGNLWYNKAPGTGNPYWGVEEQQYSIRTYSEVSGTPSNTYGLFGWGDVPNDGNDIRTDDDSMDYLWTKDWGTKLKPENSWRTLTNVEWDYIINTRGGDNGAKFAAAIINDKNGGLLLIPDGYGVSSEKTTINGVTINKVNVSNAWCGNNVISSENWANLEAAGVVFLPYTGRRDGTEIKETGTGYYWSSTEDGNQKSFVLEFNGKTEESGILGDSPTTNVNRHYGCAVRLVTDCK